MIRRSTRDGVMCWLLGLVQRNNGRPVGHRATTPCHIGFCVSTMASGLAVTCCVPVGLMLWDGGLVMVAPAQIWNPLRRSDPFSATIRQSNRLAYSSGVHLPVHMAPVLLRALVVATRTPHQPRISFCLSPCV